MTVETVIRVLTISSLSGLLLAVGLRLTAGQVLDAVRKCRLGWILVANFLLVPALAVGLSAAFQLTATNAAGLILLAAAPFAPVVPVFARMARGDLALAAGLTALFPFLCAFLTPAVCELSLKWLPRTGELRFDFLTILIVLVSTITLPLGVGVAIHHRWPNFGRRLLRPIEVVSEGTGALSLAFVTVVEFPSIIAVGWKTLLATALVGEISLGLGYALGAPTAGTRRVVAFGTSNRNIALAILVALDSFAGTRVLPAVVASGLLLILLGLLHVACWRFFSPAQSLP